MFSVNNFPENPQDLTLLAKVITEAASPQAIYLIHHNPAPSFFYPQYYVVVLQEKHGSQGKLRLHIQSQCKSRLQLTVAPVICRPAFVRAQLQKGNPFFHEVVRVKPLYTAPGFVLKTEGKAVAPRITSPRNYHYWYGSAKSFLEGAKFYFAKQAWHLSGSLLHQSAERMFNAVTSVKCGYESTSANLCELFSNACMFMPSLANVCRIEEMRIISTFTLLMNLVDRRRGVVDLCPEEDELEFLIEVFEKLMRVVEKELRREVGERRALTAFEQ